MKKNVLHHHALEQCLPFKRSDKCYSAIWPVAEQFAIADGLFPALEKFIQLFSDPVKHGKALFVWFPTTTTPPFTFFSNEETAVKGEINQFLWAMISEFWLGVISFNTSISPVCQDLQIWREFVSSDPFFSEGLCSGIWIFLQKSVLLVVGVAQTGKCFHSLNKLCE